MAIRRHAVGRVALVFFGLVFGCFGFFCVLWRWNGLRSAVFDTPMNALRRKGFYGVCGMPICASGRVCVSLSLAAAQRVVRMVPDCEVGEWWWFENSRAYLYYFFIVNDCQFVAGHADAWCRGIGQTAARFLCDAPFLIRRSSIFLFRESSCRCLFTSFFVEGSILAQDERWRRA